MVQAQGQYALLFLLRRCHGLLYRLMSESEPISEELMPIVRPSLPELIATTTSRITLTLLGKQTINDQEMSKRSPEIRWPIFAP